LGFIVYLPSALMGRNLFTKNPNLALETAKLHFRALIFDMKSNLCGSLEPGIRIALIRAFREDVS
jgi:hypothetical protein